MQPISIPGPGATRLADALTERLDGRVAVVAREEDDASGREGRDAGEESEATDGGVAVGTDAAPATTGATPRSASRRTETGPAAASSTGSTTS